MNETVIISGVFRCVELSGKVGIPNNIVFSDGRTIGLWPRNGVNVPAKLVGLEGKELEIGVISVTAKNGKVYQNYDWEADLVRELPKLNPELNQEMTMPNADYSVLEKPKKEVDWDGKDRRIVRQNCNARAVELVVALLGKGRYSCVGGESVKVIQDDLKGFAKF